MKSTEDPRMTQARKNLSVSWIFFSVYLLTSMLLCNTLGSEPYVWGLPLWVAVGCLVTPVIFVLLLIVVVERFIKDIPLDDKEQDCESSE